MSKTTFYVVNQRGERISGFLYVPQMKGPFPAVIMVPGFGGRKKQRLFYYLGKTLAENGICACVFDPAGIGESEGDYQDVTLSRLADDLDAVHGFVAAQSDVLSERIGVLGHSLGVPTILSSPLFFKLAIFVSGPYNVYASVQNVFGNKFDSEGVSERETSYGMKLRVKPPFWTDVADRDFGSYLQSYAVPKLFVHGTKDEMLPTTELDMLYAHAADPKEQILVEGADHNYKGNEQILADTIMPWTLKHL